MKSNIVLIGFMGSGKSITGKLLAYKLGYSFVDTDNEIEKIYKQKLKDMFAGEGEAVFRARETETIKKNSRQKSSGDFHRRRRGDERGRHEDTARQCHRHIAGCIAAHYFKTYR